MSDSFTLFIALLYLVVVLVLVLVFWRFIQRYLDKKYYLALSDSKDFKIGDPVAHDDLYQNGSRFSYISWFDSLYDHFCLETDDWYSPNQIRHPTPEELEKYFRK